MPLSDQESTFERRRQEILRRREALAERRREAYQPRVEVPEPEMSAQDIEAFNEATRQEIREQRAKGLIEHWKPPEGPTPILGFPKQAAHATVGLLKGIVGGIVDLAKLAKEDIRFAFGIMPAEEAREYEKGRDWQFTAAEAQKRGSTPISEVLSEMFKGATPHWRHGWKGLYYKAPDFALDAIVIANVTGGTVSRSGSLLKTTARLGGVESKTAARMTRFGAALESAGPKIASAPTRALTYPFRAAAKTKPVMALKERLGIGSETKWIENIRTIEQVSDSNAADLERIRLALRKIPKSEYPRLMDAIFENLADGSQVARLSPAVRAKLEMYRNLVRGVHEPTFLEYRALTEPRILRRRARGTAWWRAERSGEPWSARLAKARVAGPAAVKETFKQIRKEIKIAMEDIRSKKIDPVYAPFLAAEGEGLATSLGREMRMAQKVGRLEAAAALGKYETNPALLMQRALDTFHDFNWKVRWFDRVRVGLQQRGLLRSVTPDEARILPEGWSLLPDVLYKKYFDDGARTAFAFKETFAQTGSVPRTMRAVAEKMLNEPEISRGLAGNRLVAVPTHVANLISARLTPMWRPLEAIMRYGLNPWKALATIGNPRYYMTTPLGNIMLSILHGVNPVAAWRLWRVRRGGLPPELVNRANIDVRLMRGASPWFYPIEKVATTGRAFISAMDNLGRGMIYATEIEEMRKALLRTGDPFWKFAENAPEFYKAIGVSQMEASNIEVKIQRLQELVAAKVPVYHQTNARLAAVNKRLGEVEVALSGEIAGASELAKREAVLAKRVRELEAQERVLLEQRVPALAAEREAEKMARAVSPKDLPRVEKEVAKLLRAEHASAVAMEREILLDIRSRGGVAVAGGLKEELRRGLPKSLWAKKGGGLPADELAQDMFNRGWIASWEESVLFDALARMVEVAKRPKLDPAMLRERARLILQQRSRRNVAAIVSNLKQQTQHRGELLKMFRMMRREGRKEFQLARRVRRKEATKLETQYVELQQMATVLEADAKALKADALAAALTEDEVRARLPEIARRAEVADRAVVVANDFLGEYNRLLPFEQKYFRFAVPFYPFTKTMMKLAFSFPFVRPKRTFAWHHFHEMMLTLFEDPDLPRYMRDTFPVGVSSDEKGDYLWTVSVRGANPWFGLRGVPVGEVPMIGAFNPAEANPILKFGIEVTTGYNLWRKAPVRPGERVVRLDNGEAYEITGRGTWRKTIAQPSLLRSLWNLFPTSQLAEELTIPYRQTDRGWIGEPEAIRNPDGSVAYPKEFWQRVLRATVAPGLRKDYPAELKRREKVRHYMLLREYIHRIRRERDPGKRQDMQNVLRDYHRNERVFIEED